MAGSHTSTTPIAIGMVVAVVAFLASMPVMIRDSRRPLPPSVRKPVVMREPRRPRLQERLAFVGAALRKLRPPALPPPSRSAAAPGRPVTLPAVSPRNGRSPATAGAVTTAARPAGAGPVAQRRSLILAAAAVVALSLVTPRGGRARRLARR